VIAGSDQSPSLLAVADALYLNRRLKRLGVVLWDFSRRLAVAGLRLRRCRGANATTGVPIVALDLESDPLAQ